MASAEAMCFLDLGVLIDAAEDRSSSGGTTGEDTLSHAPFDPDEYAGVVQSHYERLRYLHMSNVHFEHQKQEMARENEASFLEALQKSVEFFESDQLLLDYSCLSPLSLAGSTVVEPSMWEEVLPNSLSDNLSTEITSSIACDTGSRKAVSATFLDNSDKFESCVRKGSKPFVELQKHVKHIDSRTVKTKSANAAHLTGTRLVNTKRYLRKYGFVGESERCLLEQKSGSVDARKRQSQALKPEEKPSGKRIVPHPVLSYGKNDKQCSKTSTNVAALKSSATTKVVSGMKATNIGTANLHSNLTVARKDSISMPVAPANITAAVPSQPCKRSSSRNDPFVPPKKACISQPIANQSRDHDYCALESHSKETVTPAAESVKREGKFVVQKVLKLRDYLQRVRQGTQSAPNSPAGSPKVVTGSAKQVNNFMAVTEQEKHMPAANVVNATTGRSKNGVVPLPEALRKKPIKQTFGLQEFDKYMTGLQTNLISSKSTVHRPPSTCDVTASHSPSVTNNALVTVAPMRRRKCEVKKDATSVAAKMTECHEVGAKKITTAEACGQKARGEQVERKRIPSTYGQLLSVQVPVSSNSLVCRMPKITANVDTFAVSRQTLETIIQCENHTLDSKPSADKSQQTAGPATQSITSSKLVAPSQDDGSLKSLLMNKITSPLKEILTLLAQGQAKINAENNASITNGEEKQDTLQNSSMSTQEQSLKHITGNVATSSSTQDAASLSNQKSLIDSARYEKIPMSAPTCESLADSMTNIMSSPSLKETLSETSEPELAKSETVKICHTSHCKDVTSLPPINAAEVTTAENVDILQILQPKSDNAQKQVPEPIGSVMNEISDSIPFKNVDSVKKQAAIVSNEGIGTNKFQKNFSMTRSMAAAEMMASDVIDDGTEEILFYAKPIEASEKNDLSSSNGDKPVTDSDPAVISLEEALECLEKDEILGQYSSRKEEKGDAFDNKEFSSVHYNLSISAKTDGTSVEFNVLPHYLDSDKASSDAQKTSVPKICDGNDFAVKIHPVADSEHSTPEGTAVDASETYNFDLPSYYMYGRPNPPLKTFSDDAGDTKGDTVTQHTLQEDTRSSKLRKRSKRKRDAKKKKHKHKKACDVDKCQEKVPYSKLPSYYTSGRISPNYKDNDLRRKYDDSPSPRSRYYQSSRSRSRSPFGRSPRRRPYSSRSYSRSSSRSSGDSEGGSARSWRREQRSHRSRRERSYERRSYNSSDEEQDEFVRRRESEVNRAWQEHRDTMEKEKQRAMEERRVVYVGGIDQQMTKSGLRRKFLRFGNIETVTLHFRNDGDNYAFLTFQYTCDAFRAIEEGIDPGPGEPLYNLCFGGRRQFCKSVYKDLDDKGSMPSKKTEDLDDFDALLKQAKRSLRH